MVLSTVVVPPGAAASDMAALLGEPAAALRRGGLVAFPTETVYGLGADATNAQAVERIFLAKGRPADNPLIVHIPDVAWLPRVVAATTPLARRLAEAFWPGPLTLVLEAHPDLPPVTTGGLATVAVRVPSDPLARWLIELADVPVAAPSANLSGRPSPTTAAHVAADLGSRIDWIVDGGPSTLGIESTVVDARGASPVMLREGGVTREDLAQIAEAGDVVDPVAAGVARSPGTAHAHYQPLATVVITDVGGSVAAANRLTDRQRVGLLGPDTDGLDPRVRVLGTPVGAAEVGVVLYGALRTADEEGLAAVVVEAVADEGLGRAVMDRLRRAAGQTDAPT
ncbi:MAG TPA: L-threonylcarbamoyladenylate synthase [Euzebya sp.]|nr:L-threonylcarbamoyladenylate synthase [Euzebya sp.]